MQESEEAQGKIEKEKIALFIIKQQRILFKLKGIEEEQLIQHPSIIINRPQHPP